MASTSRANIFINEMCRSATFYQLLLIRYATSSDIVFQMNVVFCMRVYHVSIWIDNQEIIAYHLTSVITTTDKTC
jgi:hypothetical protein